MSGHFALCKPLLFAGLLGGHKSGRLSGVRFSNALSGSGQQSQWLGELCGWPPLVSARQHLPRRRGTRKSHLLPVQPGQCGAAVTHHRGSSPLVAQPEFAAHSCPAGPCSRTAFLLTQSYRLNRTRL